MATLIVPWRPGDAHREAAWSLLQDRHRDAHPDWPIIEGRAPDGHWCKANAVDDALARCDDEVLVISDADVWTDELDQAVAALDYFAWAIPHRQVWRLARGQLEPTLNRNLLDRTPYTGYPGGGIVVTKRSVYETTPLDPRFVGWGQEDESWAIALIARHGEPWRGTAPLWHWWHPPQERADVRHGNPAGVELHRRYRKAERDPAAMDVLIEEARSCRRLSSTTTASPQS